MHKLPVMATVGRAYAFLRDELGTIIRVSWLLFLVTAIVQYVATLRAVEAFRSSADLDSAMRAMQESSGTGVSDILVFLIGIVATAIVAVALHRVILFGERRPGSYAHVAFGKVELLFVALSILGFVAAIVLMAVGALALIPLASSIGSGGVALIICGFIAVVFFVLVRISPVAPLAVVTRRIRFRESWRLTKGNFWRLFAVWILVILPITILLIIIMAVVVPMANPNPFSPATTTTTDPRAQVEALANFISRATLIQSVVVFFASIFGGALGVAVLSYSYKSLTGHAPDDLLTRQG